MAFFFGLRWLESLMTFRPERMTAQERKSPPEGAGLPRWLHFLGKNRFESARKLADVKSPILIAHGDPDRTIPTAEARLLFAAAHEPKKFLIVPGAGHVVFGSAGEQYLNQVEQF